MTAPQRRPGSAPIAPGRQSSDGPPASSRRPVPFVVHQIVEYLVAGALVELSLHTARPGLLLVGAVAFALLALTARGPLGVARVCGGRLHAVLDVVVAVGLAAAPILPALRPGALGIAAVEVVAVLWLRVVTLTRYTRLTLAPAGAVAASSAQPGRRDAPLGKSGSIPVGERRAPTSEPSATARVLGLFAGRAARRLPDRSDGLSAHARQAGRRAGRLHRVVRSRARP